MKTKIYFAVIVASLLIYFLGLVFFPEVTGWITISILALFFLRMLLGGLWVIAKTIAEKK